MNMWMGLLLFIVLFASKKFEDRSGHFDIRSLLLLLSLIYMALKG
ncbi:MAG TPA: hypothetical protein VFF70_14870 [Anaerolineae bacterium]|nr:hypothetical protein [Anaerolineae bacterium]